MLPEDSSSRLVGTQSGGRGALWLQRAPSLTWPDDQLWRVKFHRDGTWTPSLCLDSWVWFRGKSEFKNFGSQPTHEGLSAKGSSQKEKTSLLQFKKLHFEI